MHSTIQAHVLQQLMPPETQGTGRIYAGSDVGKYSASQVYSSELFPDTVRSAALRACSLVRPLPHPTLTGDSALATDVGVQTFIYRHRHVSQYSNLACASNFKEIGRSCLWRYTGLVQSLSSLMEGNRARWC